MTLSQQNCKRLIFYGGLQVECIEMNWMEGAFVVSRIRNNGLATENEKKIYKYICMFLSVNHL